MSLDKEIKPTSDISTTNDISNEEEPITKEECDNMLQNIDYYRKATLTFINIHKKELISIYLQHKQNDGNGVLGLNLIDMQQKNNIDVAFLPNSILSTDLLTILDERITFNNNDDIIYMLMISPYEEKIIEIDIKSLTN